MSRCLLDTNIISNITKPAPSEGLAAWMAEQADEDLFISSLTVAEIRRGVLAKPAGKKFRGKRGKTSMQRQGVKPGPIPRKAKKGKRRK